MKEIPENVSSLNVYHYDHVVFGFIGIDKCQSMPAMGICNAPYLKRACQGIQSVSNIAFPRICTLLNNMIQTIARHARCTYWRFKIDGGK